MSRVSHGLRIQLWSGSVARQMLKVGVHRGDGDPPFQWTVVILQAAYDEARMFLSDDQYRVIAQQFQELATQGDLRTATPSHLIRLRTFTNCVIAAEFFILEMCEYSSVSTTCNAASWCCMLLTKGTTVRLRLARASWRAIVGGTIGCANTNRGRDISRSLCLAHASGNAA